jgi:hypothetical protein
MKRSTAYKAVAAVDAVGATICALKGDIFFIALVFAAGIMWAAGEYWGANEEKQGE